MCSDFVLPDYQALSRQIEGTLSLQEPMNQHTSLKVGGSADCFIQPKHLQDLQMVYAFAKSNGLPVRVIGSGTNLLIPDTGIRGIVLHLHNGFSAYHPQGTKLIVQSGRSLTSLHPISHQLGLTGLGFLAGIPGTVGGAVYMNAGTSSQFISQVFAEGLVWDPATQDICRLSQTEFQFHYRGSMLQKSGQVLLEAVLQLSEGDVRAEQALIREHNEKRWRTQPLQYPNAGCTWKNPPQDSAGKLIEASGLKGKTIGKAMVSTLHANFIVNTGEATFADILALMELVEKTIEERYNIHLERELQIIA